MQDQLNCGEQGEEGAPDVDVTIESEEQQGEGGEQGDSNPGGEEDTKKLEEELSKAAEQLAEDLAAKFEQVCFRFRFPTDLLTYVTPDAVQREHLM